VTGGISRAGTASVPCGMCICRGAIIRALESRVSLKEHKNWHVHKLIRFGRLDQHFRGIVVIAMPSIAASAQIILGARGRLERCVESRDSQAPPCQHEAASCRASEMKVLGRTTPSLPTNPPTSELCQPTYLGTYF
jgi:hypothetical protein